MYAVMVVMCSVSDVGLVLNDSRQLHYYTAYIKWTPQCTKIPLSIQRRLVTRHQSSRDLKERVELIQPSHLLIFL